MHSPIRGPRITPHVDNLTDEHVSRYLLCVYAVFRFARIVGQACDNSCINDACPFCLVVSFLNDHRTVLLINRPLSLSLSFFLRSTLTFPPFIGSLHASVIFVSFVKLRDLTRVFRFPCLSFGSNGKSLCVTHPWCQFVPVEWMNRYTNRYVSAV